MQCICPQCGWSVAKVATHPAFVDDTASHGKQGPCERMPDMPGTRQIGNLEPIAWLKAADYRDYEQQIALKAHLDSLAVELSLLRSDVVDVLHRRQLRRQRDDIFRLWHFHVALEKLRPGQLQPTPSHSSPRRTRAEGNLKDLRHENTLRCATLLCFFLSSSLLQQILSNWRLVVHRLHKPLDLRAFPAWRLQLFLWAWRSAVEVKGTANNRMSLRRRLDEESLGVFQPRIRSPMIVPTDVVQLLHLKAANALRTLRDNDLAYFVLQAWNGVVVSATLAQIGVRPTAVFQPNPGDTVRDRQWTGRLAGQRFPARPVVFKRSTITMVNVLQAWILRDLWEEQIWVGFWCIFVMLISVELSPWC